MPTDSERSTSSNLLRRIVWTPAYHHAKHDSIAEVYMTWVLSDEHRAITWQLCTGWGLAEEDFRAANPDNCTNVYHRKGHPTSGARGAFVSFHFDHPTEYDKDGQSGCDWLDGRRCYGDMGFTMSDEAFRLLCRDGEEAVWKWLEEALDEYEARETERSDA